MQPEATDAGRLRDMIAFGEEAIVLLGALDAAQFLADRRTFLAVSRCVEILGEAGWKLSDAMKSRRTEIPWPLIAGMRHRLVHDYGRVDGDVVYQVVTVHLPPLMQQLRTLLAELPTPPPSA
jgi:uncharacterized protein with HEPN domain